MALIGYTITVVAKQDNPYNVLPETDISIRKNSDNTLVNIYADEAGLIPIAQLGAKTDSNGQFAFYADASLGILKAVWTNGGVIATEVLDQSDHSRLVNRNAVGAHDAIYRRETTVAEIATGVFSVGDKLAVTDRGGASFNVVSGGTADGYGVLNAGSGKTAVYNKDLFSVSSAVGSVTDVISLENSVINTDGLLSSTVDIFGKFSTRQMHGRLLTVGKNIPAINIQSSDFAAIEKFSVIGGAESTDSASSMFVNTQISDPVSVSDTTYKEIALKNLTLGFNLTKTVSQRVSSCSFSGMELIPSIDSGGYGVLLQGANKTILSDNIHISAGNDRHAVYVSRLSTDVYGEGGCEDTILSNIICDWTSSNYDTSGRVPFVARSPQRITYSGVICNGGRGSIIITAINGNARDIIINGDILTNSETVDSTFMSSISLGSATGGTVARAVIANGISSIKKGASASSARDVGMLLNRVSSSIIASRVITTETGTAISLTNCDSIIIDNIVDIVTGTNVQPVINFAGSCSKITIGSVNHSRADISGKKAIYGGVNNVSDLTCRFPRNARLSFSSGVLSIFDPWDLISGVTQNANNIVVTYNSHVTQDAADTAQFTNRSVTAVSIFKTSTTSKTATVYVTDSSLAAKDMTTYSGTIEINLTA